MPSKNEEPISYDINVPYSRITVDDTNTSTRYPEYLPKWDKGVWFEPLPYFHHDDPALRVKELGDTSLPHLLTPDAKLTPIQPRLGAVVEGVQLNRLGPAAKNELAYLIAQRKVVVFPEQDIIDDGPAAQYEFMKWFGKLNYQPVSGTVTGFPGFHIIHRDGNRQEIQNFLAAKTTTTLWHQDVSYEIQPPGYVMLGLLQGPHVGGDTVFTDTQAAYERLSPTFQEFLDKLEAIHTSATMIASVRARGGLVRKDPVDTTHPVVRVHPITGKKCLFLNGEFVTKFVGLKDDETKLLLDFLLTHFKTGHDFQARVKWSPRSVVMFDNRCLIHSAIVDYIDDHGNAEPRHIFRLCAMTEKPIPVPAANI